MNNKILKDSKFNPEVNLVLYLGDCLELLSNIPDNFVKLVVTSPPYNLGKTYETRLDMDDYVTPQKEVITECVRILDDDGSICWQVGNYVNNGEIIPLDIALYPIFNSLNLHLRNRIIWHFGHGLHAKNRFSGRYETILWFTKTNEYIFNLDPVRVPQKYPGKKHFKGPKKWKHLYTPRSNIIHGGRKSHLINIWKVKKMEKTYTKTCDDCKNSLLEDDLQLEGYLSFECLRDDLPEDMVEEAFLNDDASDCIGFDPIIIEACACCGKEINKPTYTLRYSFRDVGFCSEECMIKEIF